MYIVLAVLIVLHGLAHMVGFAAPFGYLKNPPPMDSLFVNRLAITNSGMRVLGIFWLMTAFIFLAGAVGVIRRESWWAPVTLVACLLSLALTFSFLPYAKFGLLFNVALLAFLYVNRGHSWISASV